MVPVLFEINIWRFHLQVIGTKPFPSIDFWWF